MTLMQNLSTTPLPFLLLALAILVLALVTGLFLFRARRSRHDLQAAIHDRAVSLDQRCDVLSSQLEALDRRARLTYLFDLIDCAEAEEHIASQNARHLRRKVLALRAESRLEG